MQKHSFITHTIALALGLTGSAALAQEVTLKAVNAFQEGTYFAKGFERFIKSLCFSVGRRIEGADGSRERSDA
jgi:hypothetical protein